MKSSIKIWREKRERYKYLEQTGKVISFTKIYETPNGFNGPYVVVMVEVGKRRVIGQLIGSVNQNIKIGDNVVGVVRRLRKPGKKEVIEYGVKWKKK